MFNITDTEKLRDAYIFLTFAQNAPAAAPEKKANREIFITNTKREIREYNNRPISNTRIISADYDGRLELVRLPDELDTAHKEDAAEWFDDNCYLEACNSPYDCSQAGITCSSGGATGTPITWSVGTFEPNTAKGPEPQESGSGPFILPYK